MSITVNSHTIQPYALTGSCNEFSIGQHVSIQIDCTSSATTLNKSLYFNPALFTDSITVLTDVPTAGYQYDVGGAMPVGSQTMTLINCGGNYQQGHNYSVSASWSTDFDFIITIRFFLTADVDGFMDCGSYPNAERFTKDNFDNPTLLNNSYSDVYSTDRIAKFHIGIDDGATYDYTNYSINWTARFFSQGLYGGTAEFTNFNYVLSRDGVAVTNLSAYEDTIITAQVDYATPTDKVQLFVVRVDDTTAGNNYINDLEFSGAESVGGAASAIALGLDSSVYTATPPSLLTNVGGNTWVFSHELNGAYFTVNGQYRIVIVYYDDATELTNSFITPVVVVADAPPEACEPAITGDIIHYNSDSAGNYIQTTVCDRVKTRIDVSRTDYATCLTTLGYPGNYDTYFNKYTVKIYSVTTGTVVKTATSNFSTLLAVGMTAQTIGGVERYEYSFRIPDEWAGDEYWIEHQIYFNYSIDNAYTDKLVFKQKLLVQDYDSNLPLVDQLITDVSLTDGVNPIVNICDVSSFCVKGTKIATGNDYNVFGFVKSTTDGINEEEDFTGFLDQLDNDVITSIDTTWGGDNVAEFCVDKDELTLGRSYDFCIMAKPERVIVIPVFAKSNIALNCDLWNVYDAGSTDNVGNIIGSDPAVYHTWDIYEFGTANLIATVEGYSGGAITVTGAGGYASAFTGTGESIYIDKYAVALARGEVGGLNPPFAGAAIQYTVTHTIDYGASPPSSVNTTVPIYWKLTFDDSFYDVGVAPYVNRQPPIGGPALVDADGTVDTPGWRKLIFNGLNNWRIVSYDIGGSFSGGSSTNYTPSSLAEFASQNLANEFPTITFSAGQPLTGPLTNGADHNGEYLTSCFTNVDLRQINCQTDWSGGIGSAVNIEVIQTVIA